jgi:hypothetical protein
MMQNKANQTKFSCHNEGAYGRGTHRTWYANGQYERRVSTYIVAVLKQSLVRWIPRLPHLRALELYDGNEVDDEVAQQLHAYSPKFRALSIFGSVQASYPHCCRATSLPFTSHSKRLDRCWVLLGYNLSHLGIRYKIFWDSLSDVYPFLEGQICRSWDILRLQHRMSGAMALVTFSGVPSFQMQSHLFFVP